MFFMTALGILLTIGGCGLRGSETPERDVTETEQTENEIAQREADNVSDAERANLLYQEFIAGTRKVEWRQPSSQTDREWKDWRDWNGEIGIEDLATNRENPEQHYTTKYAILDVSGDDVPELHIRTDSEYTILTCENGSLALFRVYFSTPLQYCLLENGGYIYWEYPQWTNDEYYMYRYFELNESGEMENSFWFEWQDTNNNLAYDNEDDFLFENQHCSDEEWLELVQPYLYTDERGQEKIRGRQIRGQVEWQVYCENSYVVSGWEDHRPEAGWEYFDDGADMLAEGGELSLEIRELFLSRYGFADVEALYEFDGYSYLKGYGSLGHQIEFYYDEDRQLGCGIFSWNMPYGPSVSGYIIDDVEEGEWEPEDSFSGLSLEGTTGEELVEDYSEEYLYDGEGRLIGFRSYGTFETAEPGEDAIMHDALIEIDFVYDEQGNLREKKVWNNELVFLNYGIYIYQYDENGRLICCTWYYVHGTMHDYYLYLDDGDIPAYKLNTYYGTLTVYHE